MAISLQVMDFASDRLFVTAGALGLELFGN